LRCRCWTLKPGTILIVLGRVTADLNEVSSSLVLSANDRSPESVTARAVFPASTETVSAAVPTFIATLTLRFSPPPNVIFAAA